MSRRDAITALLALGAAAASMRAIAQAPQAKKVHRIGYLQTATREAASHLIAALETGLRERGYVLGSDLVIEYRFADGKAERLDELAAELVRLKVQVIVTGVNPPAHAAKRATMQIPIVMAGSFDPVEEGLVASLARPGGNVTGLTLDAGGELYAKGLELLKEVQPKLLRVAVLGGAGMTFNPAHFRALEDAARQLKVTMLRIEFRAADDLERAFAEIDRAGVNGLIVLRGPNALWQRANIARLAAKRRLITVYSERQFVIDGGLMSYGADTSDNWRRAAAYVDRILKGAKPGDLPVEQPTKFELVVNLKTATALGLKMPQSILLRADRVIE